jgi:hypothetical protein
MSEAIDILLPAEILRKIDQNREGLSREEFIGVCLDAFLPQGADSSADSSSEERYATIKEFEEFQQRIERLQLSFIDFLVTYGLGLGK